MLKVIYDGPCDVGRARRSPLRYGDISASFHATKLGNIRGGACVTDDPVLARGSADAFLDSARRRKSPTTE
jgi:hypothetical protein